MPSTVGAAVGTGLAVFLVYKFDGKTMVPVVIAAIVGAVVGSIAFQAFLPGVP
jgi:uncharacterized membrane protein YeaQ/YmgE (transglycosylase-associated protein family)